MTKILITGKTGQVGWELERGLVSVGSVLALGRDDMDLSVPESIRKAIRTAKPEIIVNAAAYTMVDKAESEPDLAMRINGIAPGIIATEAKRIGALLVHYSTDHVFDGELGRPYCEDDVPCPVNAYGKSKLAGEKAIEAVGGAYVILRSSWIYSDRGTNFLLTILRLAREKPELAVVADQTGSPTWARALAAATGQLLRFGNLVRDHTGIYHLSVSTHTSRYEFAKAIIRIMQEVTGKHAGWPSVQPITSDDYPLPARRPHHPVISSHKLRTTFDIELPPWEFQLRSCIKGLVARGNAATTV